jgi:uncharacterized membrane protein
MTIRPAHVIGVGLGGFADGILLHQILQWHNMGSAVLPPVTLDAMAANMRWDDAFHAVTWLITLGGVFWLRRDEQLGAATASARTFVGQMLVGWGVFNLIEGVIDHHVLGLHHVRDMPTHVPTYDWLFLLLASARLASSMSAAGASYRCLSLATATARGTGLAISDAGGSHGR